jgi:hypothetical protein
MWNQGHQVRLEPAGHNAQEHDHDQEGDQPAPA